MNLQTSATKGAFWSLFGTIGTGLINFLLTLILARALSPKEFGVLEIVIVISAITEVIIDSGFGQAIIRDKNLTKTDLSSVFYLNIGLAIFFYVLLFFSFPFVAKFFNEPILVNVSRFVFLSLIFNSFIIVQNANFYRNIEFRKPAIINVLSIILSAITSIILVHYDFGIWALASNLVLFSFFKMVFTWFFSKWRPLFKFSLDSIKKYYGFSVNLMIQYVVDKIVSNIESLVIGKFYTKTDLGYFSQARKLDSYFMQTLVSTLQKVTYPVFTKISDTNNQFKEGFRLVIKLIMTIIIPVSLFIMVFSDIIILVLFGEKWIESAQYLRLLSIASFLVSLYSLFHNIFLVKGQTRKLVKLSLIRQMLRVMSVICLVKYGIISLTYGIIFVTFFSSIMYISNAGKLISYTLKEILSDLSPFFIGSIISVTIVYAFRNLISIDNYIISIIVLLLVYFTIYLGFIFIFQKQIFNKYISILKQLL